MYMYICDINYMTIHSTKLHVPIRSVAACHHNKLSQLSQRNPPILGRQTCNQATGSAHSPHGVPLNAQGKTMGNRQ